MKKIVVDNLLVGGECNLFHHGIVRDFLQKKSFEFCAGKLYGIVGEFGDGGAALSCGLTGNTDFYEGNIFIDGNKSSIEYVIENSWYVGNDLFKYKPHGLFVKKAKFKKNTIKNQIEFGVRNQNKELDFYTIQKIFDISNERVDRNIEFVSGERWKASAAIGYANGKRIFCFPWMNSKDIEQFGEQMSNIVKNLIDSDDIVIIPTTREENVTKIYAEGQIVHI